MEKQTYRNIFYIHNLEESMPDRFRAVIQPRRKLALVKTGFYINRQQ